MRVFDNVYGEIEITEPVLLDLINSPSLQRLKGINQQGMPREYYYTEVFSRFDHSLGVAILLKKLGAKLDEQIAGLIHDISHTAFSHLVDWIVEDPSKEEHQDKIFLDFLNKSEIPSILEKYKIPLEKVSDLDSYLLLEKPAPSLCADRVDYCLRDLLSLKDQSRIKFLVDSLTSKDGQIAFKTKEAAENFGDAYVHLQKTHWGAKESRARYYILSDALKKAIKKGLISIEDFHLKSDSEILDILEKDNDSEITNNLEKLRGGIKIKISKDKNAIELITKFRYIDPEVLLNGELIPLSRISQKYSEIIKWEKEDHKRPVMVDIS